MAAPPIRTSRARRAARALAAALSGGLLAPIAAASAMPVGPAIAPPGLAITVDREGPVTVGAADLAAAGWDLAAIGPSRLGLSREGRPVALRVVRADPAAGDDALVPEDALLFYGLPMTGPYTREAVYWLSATEPTPRFGRRASLPPGTAAATAPFHWRTVRLEEDTRYDPALRTDDILERWTWGDSLPAGTVREVAVRLSNVAPGAAEARLAVRLAGRTDDPVTKPDHHVKLRLDGRPVGEAHFDGLARRVLPATWPAGLDVAGPHRLAIENAGDTGALVDSISLDWVEIAFPAGFASDGRHLQFAAPGPGPWRYALPGFSGPDINVLCVTDPSAPVSIDPIAVSASTDGTFAAAFADEAPEGPGARYVAFMSGAWTAPRAVRAASPDRLRLPAAGADYVAITDATLAPALEPLLAHRAGRGMKTALVTTAEIYDAFSHGVRDPRALRAFLEHAYRHWPPPAPRHVLLAGEASLDYRGGYGPEPPILVPSVQVPVRAGPLGAVTSDLYFVALEGDDPLPEMSVGRLPVRTPAEARATVAKILAYEAGDPDDPWRGHALFVLDDDDEAFAGVADDWAAALPADATVERLDASSHPRDRSLPDDVAAAVHRGALVVAYVGHGNVDTWGPWPGGGRIFDVGRIGRLENGPRLPLLVGASCMNGWFDHPLRPVSMAETWVLHPGGGGVAAWSSSGFGSAEAYGPIVEALLAEIAAGSAATIGEATDRALRSAFRRDPAQAEHLWSFVLLGDPATPIRFGRATVPAPTPPPGLLPAYLPLVGADARPGT